MDILLDTTDIEFLEHIPFSSLYNVLKNAKGLYRIAGKPDVFFI